jgi:TIR domain
MDKMKIFISWSGPRSAAVAEVLKEYLPLINNAFDPWLSSEDIPKGSRSTGEIGDALANARAGIICLTPNNLTAPWILFEAGGIAKTVTEKPLACTLLIGLEPSQVSKPLGDFQATRLKEKEPLPESAGLLRLIKTLNKALAGC